MMDNRYRCLIFHFLFLFVASSSLYAEALDVSLRIGIGMMSGSNTSQIGENITYADGTSEDIGSPIRELELPLNSLIVKGCTSINFQDKYIIDVTVKKNLSNPKDKAEDSEYGEYYFEDYEWATYNDSLDTYSEGQNELNFAILDLKLKSIIYKEPDMSVFAGLGYMGQDLDYEIEHLHQSYPSYPVYHIGGADIPGRDGNVYIQEKAVTYEVIYNIPYLLLGFESKLDKFNMGVSFGASPKVFAESEDHHFLESIKYKAKTEGYALLASLNTYYLFSENTFMGFQLDYNWIKVNGDAKQYNTASGAYEFESEQESTSKQLSTVITIGYSF